MKQDTIPISDLEVNKGQLYGLPKNPRFIRDERFEALKKSIEEAPEMLNLRELIVYPLDNGHYVVIGGNMRLRACRDLAYTELPCKILPLETPVEKLREYTIKDNIGFGENDWDAIANEWDNEEVTGWGLEMDWEDPAKVEELPEIKEDEPVEEVVPVCQSGDIWKLGSHRLMCGDSTQSDVVALLMDGKKADLFLTDPPYNVNYGARGKTYQDNGGYECGMDDRTILNDNMEDSKFREFLVNSFTAANAVMNAGAAFYIFHSDSEGFNFRGACRDVGWTVRECLIWNKNQLVLGRQDYQWKHEPVLYGWKEGSHKWYADRTQTTVLDFDRPQKNTEHPTMKPVELFAYLVRNSTAQGDIVLDLFGGSGTAIAACEQLGRTCFTMELDPHYCDVIIHRWEELTGQKAERIGNEPQIAAN